MSKEKQTYNPCDDCQYSYTKNNQESRMCKICELEYFKDRLLDYRKQSEGEWIKQGYENIMTRCSKCGNRILWNNHGEMVFSNFCPNCGAKMKGGAE